MKTGLALAPADIGEAAVAADDIRKKSGWLDAKAGPCLAPTCDESDSRRLRACRCAVSGASCCHGRDTLGANHIIYSSRGQPQDRSRDDTHLLPCTAGRAA